MCHNFSFSYLCTNSSRATACNPHGKSGGVEHVGALRVEKWKGSQPKACHNAAQYWPGKWECSGALQNQLSEQTNHKITVRTDAQIAGGYVRVQLTLNNTLHATDVEDGLEPTAQVDHAPAPQGRARQAFTSGKQLQAMRGAFPETGTCLSPSSIYNNDHLSHFGSQHTTFYTIRASELDRPSEYWWC